MGSMRPVRAVTFLFASAVLWVATSAAYASTPLSSSPASAAQVNNALIGCAWVADSGCSFVPPVLPEGIFLEISVDVTSPTQPTITGTWTPSWTRVPIPGTGTSEWSTDVFTTPNVKVIVSAATNSSGEVYATGFAAPA
jgi:hypothetical protein